MRSLREHDLIVPAVSDASWAAAVLSASAWDAPAAVDGAVDSDEWREVEQELFLGRMPAFANAEWMARFAFCFEDRAVRPLRVGGVSSEEGASELSSHVSKKKKGAAVWVIEEMGWVVVRTE